MNSVNFASSEGKKYLCLKRQVFSEVTLVFDSGSNEPASLFVHIKLIPHRPVTPDSPVFSEVKVLQLFCFSGASGVSKKITFFTYTHFCFKYLP